MRYMLMFTLAYSHIGQDNMIQVI